MQIEILLFVTNIWIAFYLISFRIFLADFSFRPNHKTFLEKKLCILNKDIDILVEVLEENLSMCEGNYKLR